MRRDDSAVAGPPPRTAAARRRPFQLCIAWVTAPPTAVRPPSTTYCAPVMAAARSEHRNKHGVGDLIRRDIAAHRDRRLVAPADARRVGRVELRLERMDHPGVDRAGAHRIDADALAGDLAGRGLGQPDHRVFGGDIGRHARRRHQPGDRGGVDDRAAFLLQHDRQHMAQAEKDALDVDRDDLVERLLVMFGGVRPFALDAGVVEKAVDRAMGVERRLDVVRAPRPIW